MKTKYYRLPIKPLQTTAKTTTTTTIIVLFHTIYIPLSSNRVHQYNVALSTCQGYSSLLTIISDAAEDQFINELFSVVSNSSAIVFCNFCLFSSRQNADIPQSPLAALTSTKPYTENIRYACICILQDNGLGKTLLN